MTHRTVQRALILILAAALLVPLLPTPAQGGGVAHRVLSELPGPRVMADDLERGLAWRAHEAGGSSFRADAGTAYTTARAHSGSYSLSLWFDGGAHDGTDYGSLRWSRTFDAPTIHRLEVQTHLAEYAHNGGSSAMNAGIRIVALDDGDEVGTYEYWIASWAEGRDWMAPAPHENVIILDYSPAADVGRWVHHTARPEEHFDISHQGADALRIEVYAEASYTQGDALRLHADDLYVQYGDADARVNPTATCWRTAPAPSTTGSACGVTGRVLSPALHGCGSAGPVVVCNGVRNPHTVLLNAPLLP